MAKDIKRRFTISLDVDTKDVEKQVKATVGNLKTILSDLGNASDKMTYFKELADYLSQVDSELDRFKKKHGDGMFANIFGGLDSNLRKEMESVFGVAREQFTQLEALRTKMSELRHSGNITAESLKPIEQEIKDLYAAIGKLDEAKISGRGALENRVSRIMQALENFAVVFDDVNYKIKNGFGFDSGNEIENQTKALEQSIRKYEELLDDIKKIEQAKKKLESADVPKQFGVAKTENEVVELLTAYKELKATMDSLSASGDTSSLKYYETLIEYAKVATKLYSSSENSGLEKKLSKFTFKDSDLIKSLGFSPEKFKNELTGGFDVTGILQGLQSEINEFFDGLDAQITDRMSYAVSGAAVDLEKKLKQLQSGALKGSPKGAETGSTADAQLEKNKKLVSAYDELVQKVKEYQRLSEKDAQYIELDDDGKNIQDKIRDLDEYFASLGKTKDEIEKIENIFQDLSLGDIDVDSAIKQLSTLLQIVEEIEDHAQNTNGQLNGSTGQGGGTIGDQDAITANVDFSSLENTIRAEAAALSSKLDNVLKVEIVKDNAQEIQSSINGIKTTIDKISASIDNYKSSKKAAGKQAEIDTMKANLTQFFKYISDFNARKIEGEYQHQEIGAAILSDGSISTAYGEHGTVPWDRMASSLVANLTKTLLVDVHSHPWAQFYNGKKYANDPFSGSSGDLGAFRFSKELGAKLTSMITGNIMRVLDVSKLTDEKMREFKSELYELEKTYANTPEYSKYMRYDRGEDKLYYKSQDNLGEQHKVTEAFESLMYKAFERIGFSKDKVDKDLFKKYNLTDDQQLTALAERLVQLTHSSQNALSPVQRLSEIISAFGGDVNSTNAKAMFEAFEKGERTAAAVFNGLTNQDYRLSSKTLESLFTIDSAKEVPAVESLLSQISSILDVISSNVAGIANNTAQSTSEKFDTAINDIIDLKNDVVNKHIIDGVKSIFDPLNISEFKNNEVIDQSKLSYSEFDDLLRDMYSGVMRGNDLNIDEMQALLNKFAVAMSNTQDAIKQIELYEARTKKEVETKDGEVALHMLSDQYNNIVDSSNLQALLYLLSQAKIDLKKDKDFYEGGLRGQISSDDADGSALLGNLQSIQSTLDSIYGVLQGFAGIKSDDSYGLEYAKPAQTDTVTSGFSEYAEVILSNIEATVSLINNTLSAYRVDEPQQELSFEPLVQEISNLVASLSNLDSAIKALSNLEINAGNSNQNNVINKNIDDNNTVNEIAQLDQLSAKLAEVKTAVDLKTQAFLNEATVVDQSVTQEIDSLQRLLEILNQISQLANTFSNWSIPNNLFDTWKVDLESIENSVRNIGNLLNGVKVPDLNIKDGFDGNNESGSLPSNGYALETTLQDTNGILTNILGAVSGDNNLSKLISSLDGAVKELNNVANGIVQYQQARQTDTSVANARIANKDSYDHIRNVALNSLGDRALDSDVTEMKALANGIVQVIGWLQVAENAWEGFTVQVNEAGEASKLAFDANSKAARRMAAEAEALRKMASNGSADDNELKYDKANVKARAQVYLDDYIKQGKNATVQFKDSGRYTISILEEIGGLSRQIFQTFDENDEKMERTTVSMSSKTLAKVQDLQKVAEFGRNNNLISDSDDVYKRYAAANAELAKMNEQYQDIDNLSENDIVNWNTQIKLVQQLGAEVQKLVLSRKTSASALFGSQKNKDVATWNKEYTQLKDSINIPDSFVDRINKAGDAIKNAADSDAMKIAKNNWAALRAEIEKTAIEQDLYIKKASTVSINKKAYGGNIVLNAAAKYNRLNNAAQDSEFDGSIIVTEKLKAYTDAYNRLVAIQNKFKAGESPTNDQIKEFNEAKDACNQYAHELKAVIDATNKLVSQSRGDGENWDLNSDFVNDWQYRKEAFEEFVKSTYGAKASIIGFSKDFQQMTYNVKNSDGTFIKMTASVTAAGNKIRAVAGEVKVASTVLGVIGNKMKGLWTYAAARFGVDEIIQVVRQGVTYVREIDSALTELKKVTNETDSTYDAFLQTMSKTAGVVGGTVKDLTTMAAEWSRLGYSLEEAGKLAESTAILLNVSEFDDATQASEALISTMQAFQYTAEDSQHVVDILNEVGNNFAVSSDGIATALQDSASALMEGGNSMEQAVALVAAANRVVQDPNSVGSALRTISLRLRGTSVEILEEMGEATDGVVESTSKLQEKLMALTGVNILTDTGAYKDTYTILKEIGEVWQNLDPMDQAAALELMAGKNRANTLAAILNNMKDLRDAYDSALNAEGSALKENEAYLDSIQGRIDLFNNAVQTMWTNFLDDNVLKFLINVGTGLIKLVDTVGVLETAIAGVLTYLSASSNFSFDLASMLGIHKKDANFLEGFSIFGKEGLSGLVKKQFAELPGAINRQFESIGNIKIGNSNIVDNVLGDQQTVQESVQSFADIIKTDLDSYIDLDTVKLKIPIDGEIEEKSLSWLNDEIAGIENRLSEARKQLESVKKNGKKYYSLFDEADAKYNQYNTKNKKSSFVKYSAPATNMDAHIAEQENKVKALETRLNDLTTRRNTAMSEAAASFTNDLTKMQEQAQNSMFGILDKIQNMPLTLGNVDKAAEKIDTISQKSKLGQVELSRYIDTLDDGDIAFKAYAASVQDGNYSLAGFQQFIKQHNAQLQATSIKAQAAAVAHQALNMALSMGVAFLVSKGIEVLTKSLDDLIPTSEEAAEAAEDATSKYKTAQSELKNMSSTIDELSDDYARLAMGVDNFGNNINLTANEYARYNDIVNQIASMFPEMVRGYTAEGNAIIKNKGSVEALTAAYKELEEQANNALLTSAKNIMKNYNHTFNNEWWENGPSTDANKIKAANELDKLLRNRDTYDWNAYFTDPNNHGIADTIVNLLEDAGLEDKKWTESAQDYVKRAVQQFPGLVQSIVNSWNAVVNSAVSNVRPLVDAYLSQSDGYASLTNNQKEVFDSIVSSFDENFFNQFGEDATKMYQSIENMILNLKSSGFDGEYTLVLNTQTKFNNNEITAGEYQKQIQDFIEQVNNSEVLGENDKTYIKMSLGFGQDGKSDIDTQIASAQKQVDEALRDKILTLNYSDLQIVNSDKFNVDDSTIATWEQLQEEIRLTKVALTEDFTTDNFADYADEVKAISESIATYQEALESLESGSFSMTDFMALIEQFPDLAKGVDVSSKSFDGLADNLHRAIKNAPDKLTDELKELRQELLEAHKSTDVIDDLIDAIENMPVDTVDDMVSHFSTLADEMISAKNAINQLKEAMNFNPNENFEIRSDAIEQMKELMKAGKVGSESELWGIAEKFGFKYNEKNKKSKSDQLYDYIKAREKWYATDKDGNHTYDGTKSFLNAVTQATKNKETQKKLSDLGFDWSFDGKALNFDFDNENWDEIVQVLSETSELTGLTSDEFADLLVQVGQFFNIKWGDANDVSSYINKIAEGSGDASDKLTTMTKVVENYVEEALGKDLDFSTLDEAAVDALECDESIKTLLKTYINLRRQFEDPLQVESALDGAKDLSALANLSGMKGIVTQNKDGSTVVDTEAFTKVLKEAGYTDEKIKELITTIQGYQNVVSVTTSDPLGLNNTNASISSVKSAIEALGVEVSEVTGENGEVQLNVDNVPDLISTLKEKGWDKTKISDYLQTLTSGENGVPVKLGEIELTKEGIEAEIDKIFAESMKVTMEPVAKPINDYLEAGGTMSVKLVPDDSEIQKLGITPGKSSGGGQNPYGPPNSYASGQQNGSNGRWIDGKITPTSGTKSHTDDLLSGFAKVVKENSEKTIQQQKDAYNAVIGAYQLDKRIDDATQKYGFEEDGQELVTFSDTISKVGDLVTNTGELVSESFKIKEASAEELLPSNKLIPINETTTSEIEPLKLDIPEAGLPLDINEAGVKLDIPENGIPLDIPEGALRLQVDEGQLKLQTDPTQLDLNVSDPNLLKLKIDDGQLKLQSDPEQLKLQVDEGQLKLDVPENGIKVDIPDSGLALDIPDNGVSLDIPENGIKIEVPESGIQLNVPENGLAINIPEDGVKLNIPEHGIEINEPEAGVKLDIPEYGVKLDIPEGGVKLNAPENGILIDTPENGIQLNIPEGGLPLNIPEGGIPVVVQEGNSTSTGNNSPMGEFGGGESRGGGAGRDFDDTTGKISNLISETQNVSDAVSEMWNAYSQGESALTLVNSILTALGYTEGQISTLIGKIQEAATASEFSADDPLGLGEMDIAITMAILSLGFLITDFQNARMELSNPIKAQISVDDLATLLQEKGWTAENITTYFQELCGSGLETGLELDVKFNPKKEAVDTAITTISSTNISPIEVKFTKNSKDVDEYKPPEGLEAEIKATIIGDEDSLAELTKYEEKPIEAVFSRDDTAVTGWTPPDKRAEVIYTAKWDLEDPPVLYGKVIYSNDGSGSGNDKNDNGKGKANGTAHARGTAYKTGSWGAPKTETALVGELGPELLVRDGRWTTIGQNGAEFTDIRKGDIN